MNRIDPACARIKTSENFFPRKKARRNQDRKREKRRLPLFVGTDNTVVVESPLQLVIHCTPFFVYI
jgi:hypothetical protein